MASTLTEVSVVDALQVASAICGAAPVHSPVTIEFTCKFKPEEGEEVTIAGWGRPPLLTMIVEHLGHTHGFTTGPNPDTMPE